MRNSWRQVKFEEVIKANQKSKIQVKDAFDSEQYPFFTSGEKILKHPNFLVDKENIFMSTGGVAQVKYFRGRSSYSTDTFSFSCNNNFNVKFIYYLILSKINEIDYKFFIGSGLKHLQKELLNNNYYEIPPLPQQQKIASILSTCDEVIEKTEAAIAKYQALKQGMMHDLFTRGIDLKTGKLRPSYQDAPELYKESELGMIPKEWEDTKFENYLIKNLYGPRFSANDYAIDGNVKTIRGMDFSKDGEILYNQAPTALLPKSKVQAHLLEQGDVVVVTTADCGLTAVFEEQTFQYIPSAYSVKFRFNEKVEPYFIKYFMQTDFSKRLVNKYVRQGTLGNLPGSDVVGFSVGLPNIHEQYNMVDRLKGVEKKIKIEQSALAKYQQLKAGLMQDLLTGKVEVSVAEEMLKN